MVPLSFSFGCCSCSPASPPDYHENHLTQVDSAQVAPFRFHTALPLSFYLSCFNDDSAYLILYIDLHSGLLFHFFCLCKRIIIVFLIWVYIFQAFQSPKEQLLYKSSINIFQLRTCAYFCLSIGFSKTYYHDSQKRDIWNQFSNWDEDEAGETQSHYSEVCVTEIWMTTLRKIK